MIELLQILGVVTLLSYLSQRRSLYTNKKRCDVYLVLLIIFLVLFSGLRTNYNDTAAYINGFHSSENFEQFISNSDNFFLLNNPLFYLFQAVVRSFTSNANIFFIICAIFINTINVMFIKKYTDSENFCLSMFIYVTLGTLMLSIAALKQILAMSILNIGFNFVIEKKYIKYYIIVFVAGLVHSYAWLFFILPLFNTKPWRPRTYILLICTILVMYTFQSSINTVVEVADQVGKNIEIEQVFDGNSMNVFRVLVYAIVPFVALIFKNRVNSFIDEKNSLLIEMSIINLMFMMLGMVNGANLFGRAGRYFEMGLICSLPWLIKQLFNEKSVTIVVAVCISCFSCFYLYDNAGFQSQYSRKGVVEFISEII